MKVLLLAVTLLVTVGFAAQAVNGTEWADNHSRHGAARSSFLYDIQTQLYEYVTTSYIPNISTNRMGLSIAKADFCKKKNHAILGKTCKQAFSEAVDSDGEHCGGVFCDVVNFIDEELLHVLEDFILARSDEEAFAIIKEEIVNPIMEYNCRCANSMMDAWIGCKGMFNESEIWVMLLMSGKVDTTAEYLGGERFKDYWFDVLNTRIPWEDLSMMLERTMINLCQDNRQGSGKCYTYFYNTVKTLYEWYLVSIGKNSADAASCNKFDLSLAYQTTSTFNSIKDALIEKFCNPDCSDLYQKVLLGCCSAAMINDKKLQSAIKNSTEGITGIYMDITGDETEAEEPEEAAGINIGKYFGYYDDAIDMLRNPTSTCDNEVSYDLISCDDPDLVVAAADPCEHHKQQKKRNKCLKKWQRAQKKAAKAAKKKAKKDKKKGKKKGKKNGKKKGKKNGKNKGKKGQGSDEAA